jgi:GNAT superfamily N-acetyltransferase
MGLLAYRLTPATAIADPKLSRVANAAAQRYGITLRPLNMKQLDRDVEFLKEIYNRAWENNWGFVPMTSGEINTLKEELKLGVDPSLVPFALNSDGNIIGMALVLPDYNLLLKDFNGRLFPFNILRLLFRKRQAKRWLRVVLLGVLPEYRNKGIDAVLYRYIIERSVEVGCEYGEASWILEDNPMMNRGLELMNGQVYKRYHVYSKPI